MSVRAWVRAPTERGQLRATITHRNAGHHHIPEPADGTPKPFTSGGDMTFARVITSHRLLLRLGPISRKPFVAFAGTHTNTGTFDLFIIDACNLLDDVRLV